jgi:ACS family hexuronate transporter-like MFS transporter
MIGEAELRWIETEPPVRAQQVPIGVLLKQRQTWAYMVGRFLIDPVWWTFLFWLPDFFNRRFGLKITDFGPPLVAIYLLADVGSVLGGWTSSRMIDRGWSPNRARKSAMLIAAIAALPIAFAAGCHSVWIAVALIGLACAGHQAFSANLYALPGDLYPRWAAGSVIGLGGFAGAVGSMLLAKYAGLILATFGSFEPIFLVAASAYLVALASVHLLTPAYAKVRFAER